VQKKIGKKKMRENKNFGESLKQWAEYLSQIRSFFNEKGFLEVHTPTLVTSPGSEPFLDFFCTEKKVGSYKKTCYLPPSPELGLKKILSYYPGSLFEIRSCFRNQEGSHTHRTEFFMLEWYSVGFSLQDLIKESYELLEFLGLKHVLQPEAQGAQYECYSVADLFLKILDFSLTPQTQASSLYALCQAQGLPVQKDWSYDDLFHYLMLEKIEPFLAQQGLVYVTHYPPSQAALARIDSEGWAERFEIYLKGVELANAYHELIDYKEQMRRHKQDMIERRFLGRPEVPLDREFIRALKKGLPNPVSGIAFGLERFFMLRHQQRDIHFWSPLFGE
jgi:elongation factor P--(R)-beta-lysine ligase